SEALATLDQRHDFDMIVCDISMPDVSGMEVYRRTRQAYPELAGSFVFVTGAITKQVETFLKSVGGNHVLEKPFDFGALREILETKGRTARDGADGPGDRAAAPFKPQP